MRALVLILLASLSFAVLAATIKQVLAEGTGVGPPLVARGLFGVVACLVWARLSARTLRPAAWRWLLLRCGAGVLSVSCYYAALAPGGTDMVTAAMLLKTSPLWVALLAPVVVSERAGARTWVALGLGLSGVVVVSLDPARGYAPNLARAGLLLSLVAGVLAAVAYLALRALGRTDAPPVVVAGFSVALVLAGLPSTLLHAGEVARWSGRAWALLAFAGALGTGSQLLLTWAYRYGAAHAVTIAGLAEVGFQLLVSLAWFGKAPTPVELVGGLMAVGAGLLAAPRLPPVQGAADLVVDPAARTTA